MLCINPYQYVADEAKITKIFAVYRQASGFPSQSSEYYLEYCRKQLRRYGISMSYSSFDVDLVGFLLYVDCNRTVGVDVIKQMYTSSIPCS